MADLTCEPEEFRAGDSIAWTVTDTDHPAPTWTGKLRLSGPQQIDITATADGTSHKFTITKARSASYEAGHYEFQRYFETATERETTITGAIEILPDLTQKTGAVDLRTHAQIMLEAITAVEEGRATRAEKMRANDKGMQIQYLEPRELRALRLYYESEVEREKRALLRKQGKSRPRSLFIKFH